MTITEFLEARIAEDEAQAEACRKLGWGIAEKYGLTAISQERVLAECAAKRAIIGFHLRDDDVQRMVYGDIHACTECGSVDDSPVEWPCRTLKALAVVYADHADYQQEWRHAA